MPKIENPGRYDVQVQTCEFGQSSRGTPQIYLFFSCGEGAEKAGIAGYLYLSDAAFKNTLKTLRDAFGFDGNFETLAQQVQDKECSISVEMEGDDKGNEWARVKWINAKKASTPIADETNFLRNLTQKAKRIPPDAPKAPPANRPTAPAAQKQRDPF